MSRTNLRGEPTTPNPDGPFPWKPVLLIALAEAAVFGAYWWLA
jgi:hypothetical protein